MGESTGDFVGAHQSDRVDAQKYEATVVDIDVHKIRLLKMRYIDCLNDKDWLGLVDVLAEDAVVSYEDGTTNHRGRNAIIGYLRSGLETLRAVHAATNGVITIDDPGHAHGTWDLHFYWDDPWDNTSMRGQGVYSDRYVKVDGMWRIGFTGFVTTED